MHYGCLAIIERTDDVDSAVAELMEPYGDGKKWDWFQIGGRWSGCLSNGAYNPEIAPEHQEVCDLCGGTGNRAAFRGEVGLEQHPTGCNGCLGKGKRTAWPTQWKRYEGDVRPLATVTQEQIDENFHSIVCSYGYFENERYTPWAEEKFPKQDLPPLTWLLSLYPDALAVVVDTHN